MRGAVEPVEVGGSDTCDGVDVGFRQVRPLFEHSQLQASGDVSHAGSADVAQMETHHAGLVAALAAPATVAGAKTALTLLSGSVFSVALFVMSV